MKGSILDFSVEQQSGIISGNDNQRYAFSIHEWRSNTPPAIGQQVDFVVDGEAKATAVYAVQVFDTSLSPASSAPFHPHQTHDAEQSYGSIDWFVKCITTHYFNFSGRARRKEFWFFTMFYFIISLFTGIVDEILGSEWVSSLVSLGLLIPSLAVGARRLHDIDRSGWWQLLPFTIIGIFVLIYWWIVDSDKHQNRFGPQPYHD
jgi:uncharacterized membrane protein YhaH (DUF805 family)